MTSGGTVTSATQSITGIDVSSLPAGTLTYTVTLSRGRRERSSRHGHGQLDKTAPTGYSITLGQSAISGTEATTTSFTFAGAEVNAIYSYQVTGASGTPVTGTGTINSTTETISNIDVSGLPEGTLTYSVTLTDPAGNAGTAVTATATLDKTAPTGYTITANTPSSTPPRQARLALPLPTPNRSRTTITPLSAAAAAALPSQATTRLACRTSPLQASTSRRCPTAR